MPNAKYIKTTAEKLISAYDTNNPFRLAEALGIQVKFCKLGSLKGLYTVQHRIPYIVINTDLDRTTSNIICAHELGHDRLHKRFAYSHVYNEYEMYLISTKSELEANTFAAHLLISDDALELLKYYEYNIYQTAAILGTTPELLEIKINHTPDE